MTCYVSSNIAAPCPQGHWHDGPVHIIAEVREDRGLRTHHTSMFCADHCPVHGAQQMMEWKEPAQTIAGEQDALFK